VTQRDPVLYQAWEAHEAIGAALLVGLPLGALLLLLVGGAGGAAVAAVQAGGPAPLPELDLLSAASSAGLAIVLLLLLYGACRSAIAEHPTLGAPAVEFAGAALLVVVATCAGLVGGTLAWGLLPALPLGVVCALGARALAQRAGDEAVRLASGWREARR